MKMLSIHGFPEEYHNYITLAKNNEYSDLIKSKMYYLEAARILLSHCTDENEKKAVFEKEAIRLLAKYDELNKKFGRILPNSGYKVIENTAVITIIDSNSGGKIKPIHGQISDNQGKISDLSMKEVFGMDKLKAEINLKIILPLKKPEVFKKFRQKLKTGILMYGPPGCGKSLIAEAVANDAGIPFHHIKASDIKSKWVGETEKNISALFDKAKKKQPSIIFIDEFESIGRSRDNNHQAFEKNFISQLLTEIDGMGNKDDKIILIAATNEPWEIDNALLRSGRFGSKIFVPTPDFKTRLEILRHELKERPIADDIDFAEIAKATKSFSGADIVGLSDAAASFAMIRYLYDNTAKICNDDFSLAFSKIKPVTHAWFNNAEKQIKNRGLEEEFSDIVNREGDDLN